MDLNQDINKKKIRKQVLLKRNKLTQQEWEEKSKRIYEKTIEHPFFLDAEEIYCYIDYNNEAGTRKIMEKAWQSGKKVAVPKILGDDMEFFYITSLNDVEEGYHKILEPTTGLPADKKADEKGVLIILPGVAFDRDKNRMGYGKGFYDRYLDKHPSYHTLALAFQLQFVENVPIDIHDQRPEVIITEEKIYV